MLLEVINNNKVNQARNQCVWATLYGLLFNYRISLLSCEGKLVLQQEQSTQKTKYKDNVNSKQWE